MHVTGRQVSRQQSDVFGFKKLTKPGQALLSESQDVTSFGIPIGRRLRELLAPFACTVYALRRQSRSESGVKVVSVEELTRVLPLADHIVNILPDNEATQGFVNARRLSCIKPGAQFYNVGRGITVDQRALVEALQSGRLGGAYLDVTVPEPLPPGDPLWTAPNCYITPHLAGGRSDQDEALVEHFIGNLLAFESGYPLSDRVV